MSELLFSLPIIRDEENRDLNRERRFFRPGHHLGSFYEWIDGISFLLLLPVFLLQGGWETGGVSQVREKRIPFLFLKEEDKGRGSSVLIVQDFSIKNLFRVAPLA